MKIVSSAVAILSLVTLGRLTRPQWQGPDLTRLSKETGVLKEWQAGGPNVIWMATNLGVDYSSIAVSRNRVYVQGARGGESFVISLNRADGKEVWEKALGPIETKMRTNMGAAPRGTPTGDGTTSGTSNH